jgi:peptidoglycan biosynthesis protein MviN/MurJ (putative lipid II flippase)
VALVPLFGLPGAGLAIVVSELAALIGYVITARRWLVNNDLRWPARSFNKATISVIVSAATMVAIALFPRFTYLLAFVGILICMWIFASYWKTLPPDMRARFRQISYDLVTRVKGALSITVREKK